MFVGWEEIEGCFDGELEEEGNGEEWVGVV